MLDRPQYIEWLNRWKDRDLIKVVTGMRRCGKSSVLKSFQKHLIDTGTSESNILSLDFESLEEDYPTTARELYSYIAERLSPQEKTYIFLDEIQHVDDFEKVVDALYVRKDTDVYITGSNAYYLSGELATLLTGRYVELQMYPFSFREYLAFRSENPAKDNRFDQTFTKPLASLISPPTRERYFEDYLTYGGLPYAASLPSEEEIAEYLGGVFNTIIVKDIAKRRPRMNMRAFEATASFLADNIGNISSTNSIAKSLSQQNTSISRGAIDEYIEAMTENFLLFRADRYDLKGKEYLSSLEKYYLGDLGFRFWLLGKKAGDIGHRLENVVYLELMRRYRKVTIGKQGSKEIDFIASNADGSHYYQVAQTVLDESTLERELSPLRNIEDSYPKTLLTLDTVGQGNHEGIKHVNAIDWLLDI